MITSQNPNIPRSNPGPTLSTKKILVGLSLFAMAAWLATVSYFAVQYHGYDYPDEAANAFFANRYAQTGQFKYSTQLTNEQLGTYRPRSAGIAGGDYVPGSFLGFVLIHGLLLRLGTSAPLIFTLLIFCLSLVAWYRLVRRYWEATWALVSVGILMTIPAVVVYQTLHWLHASLFTSFLVMTGLALVRFQERQTWARAVVVGVAYGAAMFIRPVELIWTGPAVAILMIVHKKGWLYLLGTAAATLVIQLPWLMASHRMYGVVLGSGYTSQGVTLSPASAATATGLAWYRIFVPFGGWSWQFLAAAMESLVTLLPVLSVMTVLALVVYFRRKFVQPVKILKISLLCLVGIYYLMYYGSIDLTPPNDPALAGVLSSYVRYWLPLFVGMAAGATVCLRLISKKRLSVAGPLIAILITTNVWTSLGHFNGGLLALHRQDQHFQAVISRVHQATEPNSFIISGYFDKALLAYRLVSFHQPTTPHDWQLLAQIAASRPVYVIGSIISEKIDAWQTEAAANGLLATAAGPIDGSTLWRLQPKTTNQ